MYRNELDKCTSLSDVETHSHRRHGSRPKSCHYAYFKGSWFSISDIAEIVLQVSDTIKNLKNRSRYLGLLRFDLSFEVFGDLALGLVMMMGGVRLAGRFDGASEGRVRGPGPREGASFGLAFQPLVGRARGGCQWRGPGPLGPGTDLRGRRQLG